jgi:predicted  nucleic acid-binding Zn-ribbon protein
VHEEQPDIETRLANRVEEAIRSAEALQHDLTDARARIAELETELREARKPTGS